MFFKKLLAVFLVLAAVFCFYQPVNASTQTGTGSIAMAARVEGPPPSTAPAITIPTSGQTFSVNPIAVSGTCQATLLVRVFRNANFAGSAYCQTDGTFSLSIDLAIGANTLTAIQYDGLDQPSPTSNSVSVNYQPPVSNLKAPSTPPITASNQLLIGASYDGTPAPAGQNTSVTLRLYGGSAPYAVSIDWGDGSQNLLISRDNGDSFQAEHVYAKAGQYIVIIKTTDKGGQTAYLQFTQVISGALTPPSTVSKLQPPSSDKLLYLSLLGLLFLLSFLCFRFGERYQLHRSRLEPKN